MVTGPGTWSPAAVASVPADQLPGTVVGHVAASVGALQGGAHRCRVNQDVRRVGVRAQGVHVGVLEHQQIVVLAPGGQGVLEL